MRGERLRAGLITLAVAPATGAAALAVCHVGMRYAGHRPAGGVLRGGAFGVGGLFAAWLLGLLPGLLMALAAALLPPGRPSVRRWSLAALGPLIGISPLGWLLAASALPLASNSSYLLLSLAAACVSTLCCILALDLASTRAASRTGAP